MWAFKSTVGWLKLWEVFSLLFPFLSDLLCFGSFSPTPFAIYSFIHPPFYPANYALSSRHTDKKSLLGFKLCTTAHPQASSSCCDEGYQVKILLTSCSRRNHPASLVNKLQWLLHQRFRCPFFGKHRNAHHLFWVFSYKVFGDNVSWNCVLGFWPLVQNFSAGYFVLVLNRLHILGLMSPSVLGCFSS